MKAGLNAAYDAVEFFGSGSCSYSTSDTANGIIYSASARCKQTFNYPLPLLVQNFMGCEVNGAVAVTTGTATGSVVVGIFPDGMGGYASSYSVSGFPTSFSFSIVIADFRLYVKNGAWYVTYSSITVKLNGSTVHTFGAGTYDNATVPGTRLAPTGMPFFGQPPTIQTVIGPSAAVIPGPVGGSMTVFSHAYSGSATITAGYHVKELGAGSYTPFPTDLSILTGGTSGCNCEAGGLAGVSLVDSSQGTATASFNLISNCVYIGRLPIVTGSPVGQNGLVDLWYTTKQQTGGSSSVTCLPNVPRSIKRFAKDYGALWYRGGLPKTTRGYSDTSQDYTGLGDTGWSQCSNIQVSDNPHPRETQFLQEVGDTSTTIEDPFNYPALAPYGTGSYKISAQTLEVVVITPAVGGTGIDYASQYPTYACQGAKASGFPSVVDALADNPQLTPGLYNVDVTNGYSDALSRYIDYWGAPQWNYAYWFPPDVASGAIQGFEWPVDSARANPSKYWIPGRMQWRANPYLPSGGTKKRCDLVSAPLYQGGLQSFWPNFFGSGNLCSPVGVNRFKVQQITLPTSFTLTQAETAIWAFTNASSSFGVSSITLTPTGSPATVTATLTLGSFANDPRQMLALIKSFVLAFSGTGYSAAQISLVGVDGTSVNLGTTSGTYTWTLNVSDAKYAGSWGQNFGCGFLSTDTGTDATGSGISSTEMASNQNSWDYQLLFGFTAQKLQLVWTISDASKTITLNYPTFNLPTGIPQIVQTTAFRGIMLFQNCAGIVYGPLSWWNYITPAFVDPPTVYAFGQPMSALDWLCYKRVVFSGIAATSGLDTEWGTLYDTVEASGRTDIANGTNSFTISVNGKPAGVMVCGLEEVPPLAVFPTRARDVNMQPNGSFACESWSHAKGPRDFVSAQIGANLFDASGVQQSVVLGGLPTGWIGSRFDKPVANTEDITWAIKSGGTKYGNVSPWHGYDCVLAPIGCTSPTLHESEWGNLHVACINGSGDIRYRWSPDSGPHWQVDVSITGGMLFAGGWSRTRITTDHRTFVELRAYHVNQGGGDPLSSGTYRMLSYDDGKTWGPVSGGVLAPESV